MKTICKWINNAGTKARTNDLIFRSTSVKFKPTLMSYILTSSCVGSVSRGPEGVPSVK